jgi:ATP phosphoribosyltransferase
MYRKPDLLSERNLKIKKEVQEHLDLGFSKKQAFFAVADKWYLSYWSVRKAYYCTVVRDGGEW